MTTSFWFEDCPLERRPPLAQDIECDLIVVGAGIAGLSTAYEVARAGWKVMVIDRQPAIGGVMTPRTTAHLATELDDYYDKLIEVQGEDNARAYYASQVAAVDRIEAICAEEGIDADFARLDGFLVPAEPDHMPDLEAEYDACRRIGVDVEWADQAPLPLPNDGRALRFPRQARFHPLKYVRGLIAAIERLGGRIHGGTVYVGDDEADGRITLETEAGPKISARAALFATNSPVNDKLLIHTKQVPDRTYVIAGPVPKGAVSDALMWDTLENYHYVRLQPLGAAGDLMIVGGEDHRSGEADDMDARFARLEQWTRERFPAFGKVRHRWSGQVMEPFDFMPFSGRNPGNDNVYIHSGDSGQGITNGVAGALNISALILGQEAPFAEIFDPSRKPLSPSALADFVAGRSSDIKNFTEYLTGGDVGDVDQLAPGEGAVIRRGLKKIAAYRDPDGKLVERSAVCTHIGCIVHWNGLEKCWDCPCHGSQFTPEGEVINGPAVKPLAAVQADDA